MHAGTFPASADPEAGQHSSGEPVMQCGATATRGLRALNTVDPRLWWWMLPLGYMLLIFVRWREYPFHTDRLDLHVYMRGGQQILDNQSLYDWQRGELPFTYPSFAAVVFAPLNWIGYNRALLLFLVVSLMGLAVVVAVALQILRPGWGHNSLLGGAIPTWVAPLLVLMMVTIEPVKYTVTLGQINLMIVGLVLVDHLMLKGRWQGWLTGSAAGMKIVPAIFVLPYLVRRQWATAARVTAGFGCTVVIGAVVAWQDSVDFWGKSFINPQRVNSTTSLDNQSLYGALSRFWGHQPAPAMVVLLAVGVAGVLVVWLSRRLASQQLSGEGGHGSGVNSSTHGLGQDKLVTPVVLLATLGVASCLISPISWSHHWVWATLLLAVLVAQRRWLAAGVVWLVFYAAIQWVLPGNSGIWVSHGISSPYGMPWWQQILAHSFVLVGVWWLAQLAWQLRDSSRQSHPSQDDQLGSDSSAQVGHVAA